MSEPIDSALTEAFLKRDFSKVDLGYEESIGASLRLMLYHKFDENIIRTCHEVTNASKSDILSAAISRCLTEKTEQTLEHLGDSYGGSARGFNSHQKYVQSSLGMIHASQEEKTRPVGMNRNEQCAYNTMTMRYTRLAKIRRWIH